MRRRAISRWKDDTKSHVRRKYRGMKLAIWSQISGGRRWGAGTLEKWIWMERDKARVSRLRRAKDEQRALDGSRTGARGLKGRMSRWSGSLRGGESTMERGQQNTS